MAKIANCGHDEKNGFTGGQPGDQTGKEWEIINFYTPSYGWSYLIRWKNSNYARLFANLAIEAANNDKIGYCQSHRDSFMKELKKSSWRPGNISTACEADCSSGIIGLIKAVGNIENVSALKKFSGTYTGNMMSGFRACSDYFEVISVSSDKKVGDILLTPGHHTTCIVEVDGKKEDQTRLQPAYKFDKKKAGQYKVNTDGSNLMLRSGAGTNYTVLQRIANGSKVRCYGYYNIKGSTEWLYVVSDSGKVGYMSSEFLVKVG